MRLPFASFMTTVLAASLLAGCGGSEGPTGPSGPPVVTAVNGATLPSGPIGSTVIVEGQNFGTTQAVASGQVLFSNGSGGTVAAVIASPGDWTDGFIVTTVPTGAVTGPLVVQTSKGTSTPVTFTLTQNAPFSPSTVSWTSTSSLPAGLSGHAAAFIEIASTTTRAVYAIGGSDNTNTPQTSVYYATVGASGAIGSWTATSALPAALAFHRAVVATPANTRVTGPGYVYVLGGATDAAGTQVSATIYRGTLATNGTITGWMQAGALPGPLHSFGAVIFLGNLYVWGGATTNNAPLAAVYRSQIDGTGALGTWQTLASLPFKRAYFGFGSFAGYLYAFGGDSGTVAPNDASLTTTRLAEVVYAQIDLRSRNLTSAGWTVNPSSLVKAASKHTAAVASGNILITGGLYSGASVGSTEETYAHLNADGSTGSFNGATGSNTINAAGGGNVFNHAVTGYVDGSGAFHVLVVGGDDVNSPGTKHNKVFFY